MTEYIQVVTSVEKRNQAEKIAGTLLEKRMCACVQVVGPVSSFFWWEGKIDSSSEYLCFIKSKESYFAELESEIKAIHPYEVPEILALPIQAGSDDYLNWLAAELRQNPPSQGK